MRILLLLIWEAESWEELWLNALCILSTIWLDNGQPQFIVQIKLTDKCIYRIVEEVLIEMLICTLQLWQGATDCRQRRGVRTVWMRQTAWHTRHSTHSACVSHWMTATSKHWRGRRTTAASLHCASVLLLASFTPSICWLQWLVVKQACYLFVSMDP